MNMFAKSASVGLCLVAIAVSPVAGDTFCWTGDVSEDWLNNENWDDCSGQGVQNAPGQNDVAIIKADAQRVCAVLQFNPPISVHTVIVEDDDVIYLSVGDDTDVGVLQVQDHMEVEGTIRIFPGSTLELHGTTTSTIDGGTVVFWYDVPTGGSCDGDPHGTLQIKDNLTIQGYNDGEILGRACSGRGAPTRGIIATDAGKRLTVKKVLNDFFVHGYLDVQALMTNESASVGTDADEDVMLLSTNDKDGDDGRWFCTRGELHVQDGVEVTGANMWDMSAAASGAELHFESGCVCTCLEGDLDIRGGTVFVKDDVCTIGTTRVKSVIATAPQIIVSATIDGNFSGTCAGCGF